MKRQELELIEDTWLARIYKYTHVGLLIAEVKRLRKTYEPDVSA